MTIQKYDQLKCWKTCLLSLWIPLLSCKSLADCKPIRQLLVLAILGAFTYITQKPIAVHVGPGTEKRKRGWNENKPSWAFMVIMKESENREKNQSQHWQHSGPR